MSVKYRLDSPGRLNFMTLISFNDYLLFSLMHVIETYKEMVVKFLRLKIWSRFTFSIKSVHNKDGPLVLVRTRGEKYSHPIQLVKEKISRTICIVHKLVFVNPSALFSTLSRN